MAATEVTRLLARILTRGVKLPAIARAVETSNKASMMGLYVVIVLEKFEALLMSGLWLGPPKNPHIEEVELPKPVVVIPHQGNRMLTRASIPAITPRKFTRGSVVVKESPTSSLKTTTNRWILSVFDRNLRPELGGFFKWRRVSFL